MRILVIGSGGREHALTWKLRQSPHADEIFCAPGNAGTGEIAENVAIPVSDLAALVRFAKENRVDLTVVGPDDPLAAGIVDLFTSEKLRAFGPDKAAARIESSKIFAKELMRTHKIPTAEARTFSNSREALHYCERLKFPIVIKADGLALGKGVVIAADAVAARSTYRRHDESSPFRRRWPANYYRGIFARHGMFDACLGRRKKLSSSGIIARPQAGVGWRSRPKHGRDGRIQSSQQLEQRIAIAVRYRNHEAAVTWSY